MGRFWDEGSDGHGWINVVFGFGFSGATLEFFEGVASFRFICYTMHVFDGDRGVTVNTGACGALNSGSIPDDRPGLRYDYTMRIAFFTDTYPPEVNGVANTVARSARALTKKGHIVRVFTVSKCSQKELAMQSHGEYEVERIPSIGLPIYLGVRVTAPVGLALRSLLLNDVSPNAIN